MLNKYSNLATCLYMILISTAFALLLSYDVAYANNEHELLNICRNKDDRAACYKKYERLPTLNELPIIPQNQPIKIKVIPYKRSLIHSHLYIDI